MKVFLMYPGRDFETGADLPVQAGALLQDLELDTLLGAMAGGDKFVYTVARDALLASLSNPDTITYRQHVLADCLSRPAVAREIYDLAIDAIAREKREFFGLFRDSPDTILQRSLRVLGMFVDVLRKLRSIADEHAGAFTSEGFTRLFAMLSAELSDEYFREVDGHLRELRFRHGVLMSATLGRGLRGTGYVLHRPREQSWLERITPGNTGGYSFQIADRDENGWRALDDLRGRGINVVASALAQSAGHILSFFIMLATELAFYVGCLNLHARLAGTGEPLCFPVPLPAGQPGFAAEGLYDPCLALHTGGGVTGNGLDTGGKPLVMITGANQGGKSTFLRSAGLAQLMMQCGMFVPASSLRASVCTGVFTHFKREEDAQLESGKLDEELGRMSAIVDSIRPGALLLCNESFASTNEREGSEIADQIVRALLDRGIRVFFVTHLFDLADRFRRQGADAALFLRAERQADGRRTFRIIPGEPLPTSHGEDIYRAVFGAATRAQAG